MQWMVPFNRLGETQLHVLDTCLRESAKTHWIQGFAGTGKTVLLLHAICEFRKKNPDGSVCIVVFTHALIDLIKTGIPDHLGNIPVVTYKAFTSRPQHYDLIVVDEIQDLESYVLPKLKEFSNSLIVAGDENQSIYKNRVSPEDIEEDLSPNKLKLDVLYRLTHALKNIVRTILPNSGIENARSSRMANVQITLARADSRNEEIHWVLQQSRRYAKSGDPVAILFPAKFFVKQFIERVCSIEGVGCPEWVDNEWGQIDFGETNEHLEENDINLQYIGNQYGSLADSDDRPLVYLMTYHSAKGLDFDTVFLPFLDHDVRFWSDDQGLDRRLFFVAATRSRSNLFMSYSKNQPHLYIQSMPQDDLHKISCEISQSSGGSDDSYDFF